MKMSMRSKTLKTKSQVNIYFWGHLGGSVSYASAFGSGHDLRVLGSSPMLGSLLSGESASPSLSASPPAYVLSLSLSLYLSVSNE